MRHLAESTQGNTAAPPAGGAPRGERGSALLIAVLVMVILTLLGISYLMLAQTESQIAENELNAQQALFIAEAGARSVLNWFNDPTGTGYKVPTAAQVNRSIRWYDHDGNPGTADVLGVAGDPAKPVYRDGTDDLFDKAYRGSNFLAFMGEESHAGGDEGPPLFAFAGQSSGPDTPAAERRQSVAHGVSRGNRRPAKPPPISFEPRRGDRKRCAAAADPPTLSVAPPGLGTEKKRKVPGRSKPTADAVGYTLSPLRG